MRHPTAAQLGENASPDSGHAVTTSFTIFKSMDYLNGSVETGWDFDNGEAATPSAQYCHYQQPGDNGRSISIDLGVNGEFAPARHVPIKGYDPAVAFALCQWYR